MPAVASPPPSSGVRWRLSLLGGFRLADHSTAHTRLATRAIMALLARLALWPQRDHAREELIELLWPGIDLPTGRRRLRQALSLLKSALEPPEGDAVLVLHADRLSVRCVPGTIACDVHAFEALAKRGQREAALALYPGDLLPGFFDEWVLEERGRLLVLYDKLRAAPEAQFVVHPMPSSAPPPTGLARQGQSAAGLALRATLPSYLTRYFADAGQSERLLAQVLQHRLVTLLGPGGSGKTRLAVHLAEQLAEERAEERAQPVHASALPMAPADFSLLAFVPLAAAQTRAQLLGALQNALHIGATEPTLDTLLARLEGVKALLVLDNAEQLAGVADDVIAGLTRALPRLHLLVTSRCRLGLDGEREFPIAALPVPSSEASLPAAAASPSVVLFVDRARAVRLDFHLSERNHAVIAELVRALEGMPLAIELAASRVRAFSPAQMLARLRLPVVPQGDTPGLNLLSRPGPRSTLQSRHASMQRTIDWSWQHLSDDQCALAGAMAVFQGGCDAAMLGGVHDGADIQAGLEQLHAHSLVHAHTLDQPGVDELTGDSLPRFQLYEPIREYAAAQFDLSRSQRWRARQRAWALAWLRAMPATPDLAKVRAEQANLAVAFASAAADAAGEDAVGLLLALRPLHEGLTLSGETLAHARAAVETCTDAVQQSRGCSALAPLLFTAGSTEAAKRLAQAAVAAVVTVAGEPALAPASAQGLALGWALQALASVCWRGALNDAQQLMPWVDQAQALAEAAGDLDLLAAVLSQRAFVLYGRDRHAETARALHAQAQALWQQGGNRHAVNFARHNVAVFDFHCGRRENALTQWDAIAAEAAVLQDWRRLAIANSARCAALSDMHRWPQALQALRDSLRQSWRAMRLYDVSYDLWNLPRVLAHLRQPHQALTLMAFAAQFWQSRFGGLTNADRRHLCMVERLAARQLDARARAQAAARGRQLLLAEAVALALSD